MARRVFPADRAVWVPSGGLVRAIPAGSPVEVFVDADPTGAPVAATPADIRQLDGSAVPAGGLVVSGYSMLPEWLGPDASPWGADSLVVVVNSGPPWRVYARVDDRLDDLESRVAALEGG